MSFGERLKSAIKYRNTTQKKLAQMLNTTPQSISQYVSGKRHPKKITVAKLATALNLGYNYTNGNEPYFYVFVDDIPSSESEKAEEFNQKQLRNAIEKSLRDAKTFEDIAKETGKSIDTIQGYLQGATIQQIEGLKFLADTLNLSLADMDSLLANHLDELLDILNEADSEHSLSDEAFETLKKNIVIKSPHLSFSKLIKKELLSNFNLLNKQGQEKLYDYSCDLLKISEYSAVCISRQDNTAPDEPSGAHQKEDIELTKERTQQNLDIIGDEDIQK